jgi:CRISPR-associated protein Csd2
MADVISNKYDFIVLFDVMNGNPNGDPDAGNMPRVDAETGIGIVTDVCLKRKIRNYVTAWAEITGNAEGHRIYIQEKVPLNQVDKEALKYIGVDDIKEINKTEKDIDSKICRYMCDNFYDIRTFGAVMTTFVTGALNCGQVRGPVQFGFAHSIDEIVPQEISITRLAITKEEDAEKKRNEFGRKYIVPYGLYQVEGYISANLAKKTGFTEDDLDLLWKAIINMFEDDHSAARGNMSVRKLIVFKHDSIMGNAPSYKLFELVHVQKKEGVVVPRAFGDYEITVDEEHLPAGVQIEQKI